METSLSNIVKSNCKYRLEFKFQGYTVNFQPSNTNQVVLITDYEELLDYNQCIKEACDIIRILNILKNEKNWVRIKIKFYSYSNDISIINNIKQLLIDFRKEWEPFAKEKLNANFEYEVNDGLWYYFADDWPQIKIN